MRSSQFRFAPLAVVLAVLCVSTAASPAHAQVLRRLKQRATQAVEKQIDARAAEAQKPAERAADAGEAAAAGETTLVNYDFVPGERVLFFEDFAGDRVGDFPRRLSLKRGNLEVAEVGGARYLRATSHGEVEIALPEALPERFTLELDYLAPAGSEHQFLYFTDRPNAPYVLFRVGEGGIEVPGETRFVANAADARHGRAFPVRVMADGKHVKVYVGGTRVANVPQVDLGRGRGIRLRLNGASDRPALIGNLRVAAGGRELYDALAESGRVATQGILFETGSDRIRPESAPTLEEIGAMLREHPDLRLTIEGHTDSVGGDEANQALSEKRAAAVRAYLVERFSIDAARLEARGFGESRPAASNDTPEGRQQNRRVELVRM